MPSPARMTDLDEPERIVLRCFRHWLAGLGENAGAPLSMAWNEMARAMGPAYARAAMSGLVGMVREMRHLRRPLRHHRACCPCVTRDEVSILSFVAACQGQDAARARGQAEWLVLRDGVEELLEHGSRIAAAMRECGLILPLRAQVPPSIAVPRTTVPGTLAAVH